MDFDDKKIEAKIISIPQKNDIGINVDAQIIVEYYSR